MTSLEKPPAEQTPEDRLRQMLSEAVEPVQPGPGAEARLQAKIRAGRRERDLPRRLRWAGATVGVAALVAGGVLVVSQTGRSDGSQSSSTAVGAPAAAASTQAGVSGKSRASRPSTEVEGPAGGAIAGSQKAAGAPLPAASPLSYGAVSGDNPTSLDPLGRASVPSDLNADHVPDRLSISGQSLVVSFSGSSQSVTLPQLSSGARVLGVTQLQTAPGAWTPVAFIRLGANSAQARDTLVAVVGGKLTVLRLGAAPVVLAVTPSRGYTCAGPLVVTAGTVQAYFVSGAELVATDAGGYVAKPGANCSFN